MEEDESRVVLWKRKPPCEPSTAVVFARQYAESRGLRKLDFRKVLAQKTLREMGFDSILDLIVYQLHQEEHRHIMSLCNLHFRSSTSAQMADNRESGPFSLQVDRLSSGPGSFMQLDDSSDGSTTSSNSSNDTPNQSKHDINELDWETYIDCGPSGGAKSETNTGAPSQIKPDGAIISHYCDDPMADTISAVSSDDTTTKWKTPEKTTGRATCVNAFTTMDMDETDQTTTRTVVAQPKRSRFILLRTDEHLSDDDDDVTADRMDWILTAPAIVNLQQCRTDEG